MAPVHQAAGDGDDGCALALDRRRPGLARCEMNQVDAQVKVAAAEQRDRAVQPALGILLAELS
jgi:hypothetical protein